jgi:predicted metalloprotease with PDZ domain
LWRPIAEKDLPEEVAQTLAKEDGQVETRSQFELRAGLQFAPLDDPRIVYQLELEQDGKTSKLNLRADGSIVPAPVRPGPQNRSFLGLAFEKNGTTVSQVVKGGPAEQAGIKTGDKLLMFGDVKTATVADLLKILQSTEPGTEVKVQLQRDGDVLTVSVKLAAPPE